MSSRKSRPEAEAENFCRCFGVVVRREVHEVAAVTVREKVAVVRRENARDHELGKGRNDGFLLGDDGANSRDAARDVGRGGAVVVHAGYVSDADGLDASRQELLLLICSKTK